MKNLFVRFVREEKGQDLIEYALLTGIIAVGVVAALASIGTQVLNKFNALVGAF
jgi:pilus assembly protein Flp/PilA